MMLQIKQAAFFKVSFSLFIFFFSFALIMVGNTVGGERTELPTVMTNPNYDMVLLGSPNDDEGMTRNQSNFPTNPEIYVPLAIPEPTEPERITQGDNNKISYNMITGEEYISESPPPTEDMLISGLVNGDMDRGIISQKNIHETGTIEDEYGSGPINFSALSLINNPEDSPWRVNVKLYMTFAGGNYVASGVLIDPTHVLTAGHCVHEILMGGTWATSIVVVPAYENGLLPYGDASAVQLHSWTGWTNDANFDHDMAVIDLDRPIGAITGWHGYGFNNDPNFYTGNIFNSAGYPAESPYTGEYMYYWSGDFDFTEYLAGVWAGEEVGFNERAYGGQSGSGVYIIDSGSRYVYAVISNTVKAPGGPTKCPRITSGKFGGIGTVISDDTPSTFDLIPLDVTSSPSPITAGNQLSSMSYLVHNYSSASRSGTVDVNVYLSTNDDISTADTLIQSHSFTWSFSPKSSVRVTVSTPPTIPIDTTGGDYFLGVILNISDYNSGNNDSDGQDASPIYVNPENTPPPAPTISSPTHPNENIWYSNDDPTFNWTTPSDPSGIAGYSYALDNSSSTTPDTTIDTTGNTRSYANLANGEWYFHVRARDNAGNWGSADHYRVRIDDTPPVIDPIPNNSITEGTPYTGPTPSLSQVGPSPMTWSLLVGPSGMSINSSTGVVSWPNPTVIGSPHQITIRATNTAGFDDESWLLTVETGGGGGQPGSTERSSSGGGCFISAIREN